jgi:methionyl-tRNA synthetase
MSRFYITTAIVYSNNVPALHTLYEVTGTDAVARFHRLMGDETFFLTGTDEHGLKMERSAREAGKDPRQYTDEMAALYQQVEQAYHVSYDRFIRTTDPDHALAVDQFLRRMQQRGDVYRGTYEGWYCVGCEAFKMEDDLVGGVCPLHPSLKPAWIKEQNYFFALAKYQDRLLEHLTAHPEFVEPATRRNEILAAIRGGLRDFSISRSSVRWGIPFPGDSDHVVYVWGDALINYLTGVGFGSDESRFKQWWPANVHVIGKDISRFHCIYWPAMLMSAGLPLPKQVWVHGWITQKGERMSKTAGTSMDPMEVAQEFGSDAARYCILREVPFDRDGDISWESMTLRYNTDLANDLGNLVYRTLTMLQRYYDGKVPAPAEEAAALDRELRKVVEQGIRGFEKHLKAINLTEAMAGIWAGINRANKYIEQSAPWNLAKRSEDRKRLDTVMYNLVETIRLTAFLISPFMPETAEKIAVQVKIDLSTPWATAKKWGGLRPRTQTQLGEPLFPRIEKPVAAV